MSAILPDGTASTAAWSVVYGFASLPSESPPAYEGSAHRTTCAFDGWTQVMLSLEAGGAVTTKSPCLSSKRHSE